MTDSVNISAFIKNKSLFSDHYLDERLGGHKEWNENISVIFDKTIQLYEDTKDRLPKFNEAQTEDYFIKPLFVEILGFSFDVQHTFKQKGRNNRPDYTLFSNSEDLIKAQEHSDEFNKYITDAIAIADAKYWERSLDGKGDPGKESELSNANPSFQIVNYLTVTGKDWGILTNGRYWRLYYAKARSRVDSYFEVDLKEILESGDETAFKYFYHFFRSAAFQTDPVIGKSFLESIYDGSIDYGAQLERRLKDLIFDNIFLRLARGFVEFRQEEKNITQETPESLKDIHQGTLRLLYRLLFLLHAESRGLLPLDNKGYLQYSLLETKREIAKRLDEGITQSKRSFDKWNDLDSLFHIIDKGDPDLNVPRYNGGLFRQDHPNNHFLTDNKISDKYLVPALELLTRESDPESGQKRFIDYKSLDVEQLGSIYEGLLEFHLRIASEPLDVKKKKRKEIYKPLNKVKNPIKVIDKDELYLENDKGERKATGSYYTPHYIVEYIVELTLGPVFKERTNSFKNLMTKLQPKYEAFHKLDKKIKDGDKSTRSHTKRKNLHLEINTLEDQASETLLSIKICDPAMGSGHFLKEATDKLAEKIITLLAEYPKNPVTHLLEEIRKNILESLSSQDIKIDPEEHLKDTNLIKRMVMKRCIYGVDLNPMAVELAKLSLWLDSFTVGAPLSFLDHHLRIGNSLIGTSIDEVENSLTSDTITKHGISGQLFRGGPFTGMLQATKFMNDVANQTDATFEEIEKSINKFDEYQQAISPYKKALDLWVSQNFGNKRAQDIIRSYGQEVLKFIRGNEKLKNKKQKTIFENSQLISNNTSVQNVKKK